jgi:hypothetical protein
MKASRLFSACSAIAASMPPVRTVSQPTVIANRKMSAIAQPV